MPTRIQSATRFFYILSQFATVFFQFAGSISSFYEYEENQHQTHARKSGEYALIALIAFTAASIFSITANKFQGVKIIENTSEEEHDSFAFTYEDAPRTQKSNFFEISYLIFSSLLTITNNYFTLAGIKAYLDAFSNPKNVESILPLNTAGLTIMVIKTFLCDLPFNFTNASYEAAEEIKKDFTGSKEGPLVSLLVKPLFANKFGLLWITWVGTITHALWDFTGLLLCIPPEAFLSGFKRPKIFWPFMTAGTAFILIPLVIVNLIQTRYFEAKESEINVKSLIAKDLEPLQQKPKEEKSLLYKALKCWPWLKLPLRYSFYTQGPLHAFADAMPALLLLRHVISGSLSKKLWFALPAAGLIWLGSAKGTNDSEVKYSIHHFSKEFGLTNKERNDAELPSQPLLRC